MKRLSILLIYAGLFFNCQFSIVKCQMSVPLCSDWVATVDEQTQRIVLKWRPSPGDAVMGYHICSGSPCVDYDTVFGRLDTTYICMDHSPLERHTYRLHVFDSSYNVSQLTPPFGNMVLTADIPECEQTVRVAWSPCDTMPGGLGGYRLMAMLEPRDSVYSAIATLPVGSDTTYTIDLPDEVTRVNVKVQAFNQVRTIVSQSNVVSAVRQTIRHATANSITTISYDSVNRNVRLGLLVDTAFTYTIWRSIDGSPWSVIDTVHPATTNPTYIDRDISRYGLLHCYQISVKDKCGLNDRYSHTVWITVPEPPPINISIPNIIIVGSEQNGSFRPVMSGIMGDIYEMNIYSRSGLLVFRTADPAAAWQPARDTPQGAYTYNIRVRFSDNKIHRYVGTIVIIK